jgi:hypothetical protein
MEPGERFFTTFRMTMMDVYEMTENRIQAINQFKRILVKTRFFYIKHNLFKEGEVAYGKSFF